MSVRLKTYLQLVAIVILMFIPFVCNTQSYISRDRQCEFGASLGSLMFLGDVQGNKGKGATFLKDLNTANTKLIQGVFFTYYPNYGKSRFGWKVSANHGTLTGADSLIKDHGGDELFRKRRNLSFKTTITEAYGSFEFYFSRKKFRPYITAGIGMVYFTPKAFYKGEWHELRPLQTEGIAYKTTQFIFPIGIGFKYYTAKNKVISFEVLHRKTGTDYLDDVSTVYINPNDLNSDEARALYMRGNPNPSQPITGQQRGDPSEMDSYFSVSLKYSWLLKQNKRFLQRQSRQCPRDVY